MVTAFVDGAVTIPSLLARHLYKHSYHIFIGIGDGSVTYEFLETLYKDVVSMVSRLVVKRTDLAEKDETKETVNAFELYYSCLRGSRYFYNFASFDVDILEKYLPAPRVRECIKDANKIPEKYRSDIVEAQAIRVIETYEEKNEYYRMLTGLPRLTDHRWIYIKNRPDIPDNVPIHQMTVDQISRLELDGTLEQLKKDRPDAEYLDYLGANGIDLILARTAKPFDILRLGQPDNTLSRNMFEEEYFKARRYVMAVMYNRSLFTDKTLYDPVIGMIMLVLAIRNTMVPDEAHYLNFEEILDAILESYGFYEYFKNFPFIYKRRLVLSLDHLLQNKGTDGVLVDICRIFSMENFYAKRYFLMKTHARDEDGNVIFSDDPEVAYDLNFVKADIEDHNITYQEEDITQYEAVVDADYLWQLTDEERRAIMSEDFNIMMTKYIGIEAMYDLTELTFEVCYFINLLLQSRSNILKVDCVNKYSANAVTPVHTMILFLLAALAKRSGFDGNIIYRPDDIAEILRFNYGDIDDSLREIIDKYELQIDVDRPLVTGYDKVGLKKPLGFMKDYEIVETYIYNRDLYNAILKEMHDTQDIRHYIALSNAKDCMYISAMEHKDFVTVNGAPAATYYDALNAEDPKLTAVLDEIDMEKDANELDKLILYILEKLEDLFSTPELKYLFLNTPNTYGTLIQKYLRMAINVFKAAPVQLESINTFFTVGEGEPIRVIDEKILRRDNGMDDTIHIYDEISIHKTIVIEDTVHIGDKPYIETYS